MCCDIFNHVVMNSDPMMLLYCYWTPKVCARGSRDNRLRGWSQQKTVVLQFRSARISGCLVAGCHILMHRIAPMPPMPLMCRDVHVTLEISLFLFISKQVNQLINEGCMNIWSIRIDAYMCGTHSLILTKWEVHPGRHQTSLSWNVALNLALAKILLLIWWEVF